MVLEKLGLNYYVKKAKENGGVTLYNIIATWSLPTEQLAVFFLLYFLKSLFINVYIS